MSADALALPDDALALSDDALALQGITKLIRYEFNEILHLGDYVAQ
ncbi:hypothetical protein [Nostoc sp. UIC 10630]|nr:hypothetical protein [Nostoc sp. UIC 10630]